MSSTRVSRRIAADPTSVALLLADPMTVELWPGLARAERAEHGPGQVSVVVGSASGELRLLPPSRTPTAFILRFDFDPASPTDADQLRVEGRLELSMSATADATEEPPATDAVLEVRSERDHAADAALFLERVAAAAEQRSHAA